MFFKKKKAEASEKLDYDRESKRPVLRCSICNGEQVAGLRDIRTGRFEEIMLVKNGDDLKRFQEMAGTEDIPREY
ncbi:MAG: aspartate dehydrogenase [Lachnospiraceae bacterium]|nr:aspartate dehydrogenase [Lachnospiraceae bacterium]